MMSKAKQMKCSNEMPIVGRKTGQLSMSCFLEVLNLKQYASFTLNLGKTFLGKKKLGGKKVLEKKNLEKKKFWKKFFGKNKI